MQQVHRGIFGNHLHSKRLGPERKLCHGSVPRMINGEPLFSARIADTGHYRTERQNKTALYDLRSKHHAGSFCVLATCCGCRRQSFAKSTWGPLAAHSGYRSAPSAQTIRIAGALRMFDVPMEFGREGGPDVQGVPVGSVQVRSVSDRQIVVSLASAGHLSVPGDFARKN